MSKSRSLSGGDLDYWKATIGSYISKRRNALNRGQKEHAVRATLSNIEGAKANPSLRILLREIAAVNGNISDVFQSRIPRSLHGEHRTWHEKLQTILSDGGSRDVEFVQTAIQKVFDDVLKRPDKGRK